MKLARFKGRRQIWRRVNTQRKPWVSKVTNQEGLEGEEKGKEIEGECGETSKPIMIEQRIGDELIIRGMCQSKVVKGHIEDEQLQKLQMCLVMEVATFCETESLVDRMAKMGLGEVGVKRIRGNYFLQMKI